MTQTMLLAILFFAFTAWADEADLSPVEVRMQETKSRLALTEKQKVQLKPILEDHFDAQMAVLDKYGLDAEDRDNRPDAQTLRALRQELEENRIKTSKRLSGILSSEQLAEFEKIQAQQREQMRNKFRSGSQR